MIGSLMVGVGECVLQRFRHRHWPSHAKLVGEHQPSFTQGRPAQFGFLIDGELGMMEAALGLGAKCREVVTIDFGNVCHVSKLLRKLKNTTGNPHLLSLRRCPHDKNISIR
jgi:hypothetical protein